MALDLTGLTKYTNETGSELIKEAVLTGRTVDLVTVQGGIKHKETINRLSGTLTAQAGACGWTAAGTTLLDQRTIEVSPIKINEAICLDDLESYYTSTMMNAGSYNEDIPFEQIFAEDKRDKLKALIEELVWKSNKSTGSGNLALADGLVKLLDAEVVSPYDGTYTIATFGANAIDIVDAMIAQVNEDVIDQEDMTLFMSYSNYRLYAKALRDANLFHYNGAENQGQAFSQMHPGTNVKVVAVKGLNGINRLVLTPASNIVVGTDLLSDAEDFKVFYSVDNDEVRFLAKFKVGVQVQFINYVVMHTGA
tara:strand:+ start:3723 stop:4646 length:924 start_codon:yes stop_codon:yes gene_type:complete